MSDTRDTFDSWQPSHGVAYGTVGVILLVLGGALLAQRNEDPTFFTTAATVALSTGLYWLIAGAVARGIQLARR